MEIENHKEEVPFAHYEALFKDLNPQEVLERLPDVGFDGGAFQVTLLGRSFSITYPGCEFSAKDGGTLPPLPTRTFLLRYLLESKQVADFIAEKYAGSVISVVENPSAFFRYARLFWLAAIIAIPEPGCVILEVEANI